MLNAPDADDLYNTFMKQNPDIRVHAFEQLKRAQQMIEEGRKELDAAHEKIKVAQELIDESADALRSAPPDRLHVATGADSSTSSLG